jgi:dimeric dUTPase (all-alpha-NTP-PPase superfamily)
MDILEAFSNMASQMTSPKFNQLDIDQIRSNELNGIIDYDLWLETIELQKSFNDQVAPGWQQDRLNKKYNYWMAVLDETVEVLNSRHWKWWKDSSKLNTVDWDNVSVELIDIFHFVLSLCIQNELQNTLFMQLVNMEMNKEDVKKIKDEKFFESFWEEFLMAVQMKLLPVIAVRLVEYWYRAGNNIDDLFREYRVKASLNKIRQEFGYGVKNSYHKMWLDTETGNLVEDNVIAHKITKEVPIDKNTIEIMTDILRDYYLKNIAI